jgi:hypothetical protein
MRLLIGEHHAMVYDMESYFSSIGMSDTKFIIFKLNIVYEVHLRQKEAKVSPQGSM